MRIARRQLNAEQLAELIQHRGGNATLASDESRQCRLIDVNCPSNFAQRQVGIADDLPQLIGQQLLFFGFHFVIITRRCLVVNGSISELSADRIRDVNKYLVTRCH
jgi:hypothetical protein